MYHCTHAPNKMKIKGCFCRKPNPGIILRASKDHQIELSDSIMVGDKITDMIVAKKSGIYKRFFLKENLVLLIKIFLQKVLKVFFKLQVFKS